jgi:hypothetical protein
MLMAAFPRPLPRAEDIFPSTTDADARYSSSAR